MSANPVDRTVNQYMAARNEAKSRAEATENHQEKARKENEFMDGKVKEAFDHIADRLEVIASDIKAQDPSPSNQARLDRQNEFTVTLHLNSFNCTVQRKYYGPADSGTVPGIVVDLPNNKVLDFHGSMTGNTFFFTQPRQWQISQLKRVSTHPGVDADAIVDNIMQNATMFAKIGRVV